MSRFFSLFLFLSLSFDFEFPDGKKHLGIAIQAQCYGRIEVLQQKGVFFLIFFFKIASKSVACSRQWSDFSSFGYWGGKMYCSSLSVRPSPDQERFSSFFLSFFLSSPLCSSAYKKKKGAAFAAYNFSLALQKVEAEDESSVIFVTGLATYLKTPLDPVDGFEFLSILLR